MVAMYTRVRNTISRIPSISGEYEDGNPFTPLSFKGTTVNGLPISVKISRSRSGTSYTLSYMGIEHNYENTSELIKGISHLSTSLWEGKDFV